MCLAKQDKLQFLFLSLNDVPKVCYRKLAFICLAISVILVQGFGPRDLDSQSVESCKR